MKGKFRKRSSIIWCPLPTGDLTIENEDEARYMNAPIGTIIKPSKNGSSVNMENCSGCDYFEEFALDGSGVFCTYPTKIPED